MRQPIFTAVLAAGLLAAGVSSSQGFPNVPQTPGTLLSGLNAPQQGRTAIIAYHNGILFTLPENISAIEETFRPVGYQD